MKITGSLKLMAKDILRFIFWYPGRFIISFLPLRVIYMISSGAGIILYYIAGSKRKIIIEELARIFGNTKNQHELNGIAREGFMNMCKDRTEILLYPGLTRERVEKMTFIEGMDKLDRALLLGKGVILLIAHFGANKMVMPALGFKGYKINQIAGRPIDWGNVSGIESRMARKALELELNAEKRFPAKFIYITSNIRPAIRCLKNNEILCLAVDGGGGVKRVRVNFLGRPANLSPNFITLAKATGATILPTFVIRQTDSRHRILIEEPLILKAFYDEQKEWEYNTQTFADMFSKYFDYYPHLYARKLLNMRLQARRDPVPFFDDYYESFLPNEDKKYSLKEKIV